MKAYAHHLGRDKDQNVFAVQLGSATIHVITQGPGFHVVKTNLVADAQARFEQALDKWIKKGQRGAIVFDI